MQYSHPVHNTDNHLQCIFGVHITWYDSPQLEFTDAPPTIVCFPKFQCFFWNFFSHMSLFFLDLPKIINLQDPHHAQNCSVHKSLLRGTYVGNYWKRWVLWAPLLPPISLPGLVRIGFGHILEKSQVYWFTPSPQHGRPWRWRRVLHSHRRNIEI